MFATCVLAVDSLMNNRRAICEMTRPSTRSSSTSVSRGESLGPVGACMRRCIASARSRAVKARGLAAACRAAATTSSAGAALPTNAAAPESRAAKSLSSPAYIVRTTMPRWGSGPRGCRPHDLEVARAVEGPAQAFTDELVVVDQQHGDSRVVPRHLYLLLQGRRRPVGPCGGAVLDSVATPPGGETCPA